MLFKLLALLPLITFTLSCTSNLSRNPTNNKLISKKIKFLKVKMQLYLEPPKRQKLSVLQTHLGYYIDALNCSPYASEQIAQAIETIADEKLSCAQSLNRSFYKKLISDLKRKSPLVTCLPSVVYTSRTAAASTNDKPGSTIKLLYDHFTKRINMQPRYLARVIWHETLHHYFEISKHHAARAGDTQTDYKDGVYGGEFLCSQFQNKGVNDTNEIFFITHTKTGCLEFTNNNQSFCDNLLIQKQKNECPKDITASDCFRYLLDKYNIARPNDSDGKWINDHFTNIDLAKCTNKLSKVTSSKLTLISFCKKALVRAQVSKYDDFTHNLDVDNFINYCKKHKKSDCKTSNFNAYFHPHFNKCLIYNGGNILKCDTRKLLKKFQHSINHCLDPNPTNVISFIVQNMRYLDHLIKTNNMDHFPTELACSQSNKNFIKQYHDFK